MAARAGGCLNPFGNLVKEMVAILVVSGSYTKIRDIAATGKRHLGLAAVSVKRPGGNTTLLYITSPLFHVRLP